MIDLCTVGDLSWLVILPIPHMPLIGEVMFVQGSEHLLGNDAAIVALLAARQGLRCCFLATNAIATHDGLPLLNLLTGAGVDISHVQTGGTMTPTTFFLTHIGTDERVGLVEAYPFHNPAPDAIPPSTFAYIDMYEEYTAERLALIKRWSQAGVRCLINLSASDLLEKARLLTSVPSIDTLQMRGSGDVATARTLGHTMLQLCSANVALVTLGEVGAVLVDRADAHFIPAEVIWPRRTIGTGASFSANFLCALSGGATHLEAAVFASKQVATFYLLEKNPLEVFKT